MITKQEFIDWRGSDITQELFKSLIAVVEDSVGKIIQRRVPDVADDQFLKGYIAGLDASVSWVPILTDDRTGEEVDALAEDQDEA